MWWLLYPGIVDRWTFTRAALSARHGKGGSEPSREFNYQQYLACIRRCRLNTVTLMIGLILVGVLVVLFMGGSVAGMVWVYIIVAAIGAPLFLRLICCAYDN